MRGAEKGKSLKYQIQCRQATEADIPILVTLVHAAFEEYRGRLDPPSGAHHETAETMRHELTRGWAVLALVNNTLAGCVFYRQEDDHVYLGRLSVLPPYRQHGVGQALIEYVERRAQALNVPRVQLGVRVALPHLQAYYERRGYRVIRYEAHKGYTAPTSVLMEKHVVQ
jgi:ribosomal protein S18 acetylase RimI-like enzyme